jgi:putative membrane protein
MITFSGLAVTMMDGAERVGRGPGRAAVVVVLLVMVAVAVLVAMFVTRWWRNGPNRRAQGVLAERYARGEIDEAEYRERSAVLRG